MATKKITLSDTVKKDLRIIGYLIASGVLGWLLATYIVDNPILAVILSPSINWILYRLIEELKNEGYVKALGK